MISENVRIAIIGLGYVGLPLAEAFSEKYSVTGFDIDEARIRELKQHEQYDHISITSNADDLKSCSVFIVTVPTPVDVDNRPDLTPLISATEIITGFLKVGDYVIFESTVYPGVTEEICAPILSKAGLTLNKDYFLGYSPERINPGDKTKTVTDIKKVTSGSNSVAAEFVDCLYRSVIKAGTHLAPSIRVAEASKVLENIQRDVNIALVNQVHQLFDKIDVDTEAVIQAASTKWNFMSVTPGLVGGHCIGVDPYYLIHKSQSIGYVPDLITSAREINDGMAQFFVHELIKRLIKQKFDIGKLHIAVFGFAFKPNCEDIRNTKIVDVCRLLQEMDIKLTIIDPLVDVSLVNQEYGLTICSEMPCQAKAFDIGIMLSQHDCFDLNNIAFTLRHPLLYSLTFKNLIDHNSCPRQKRTESNR